MTRGCGKLITTSLSGAAQGPLHHPAVPAEPFAEDMVARDAPAHDLLHLVHTILDDAKAEEVVTIDLLGKTSIADQMVIATGRSDRHVAAIADQVIQACKGRGHGSVRVEGLPLADWVLIDIGDVIVHIFKPDIRNFYNLEKMWGGDRPTERLAG